MDTDVTLFISGIIRLLQQFVGFYEWILTVRVILYWFPNFNPYSFPFSIITYVSYPFLRLFSGILPSLFGMDLSLYVGFLCLEAIKRLLEKFLFIL